MTIAANTLYSIFQFNMENRILQKNKKLLANAIRHYKEKHSMNYEQPAKHWGVCKTTLYRAANENWQRPTAKLVKIAALVDIELVQRSNSEACEPILTVINEIWDGTDEHASQLARLFRDIHRLIERQR